MKKKELSRLVEQVVDQVITSMDEDNSDLSYYKRIYNKVDTNAVYIKYILDMYDDLFIWADLTTDKGTILSVRDGELIIPGGGGHDPYAIEEILQKEKPKYLIFDFFVKNNGIVVAEVYNIVKKYTDKYNYDINNLEINNHAFKKPGIFFNIYIPTNDLSTLDNFCSDIEKALAYVKGVATV